MELTPRELQALKVLAYFYYQTGAPQSAKRAVKTILALQPNNLWAQGLLILCENSLQNYERVLSLTEDLSDFKENHSYFRALSLVKARALQKCDRHAEAKQLLARMGAQ